MRGDRFTVSYQGHPLTFEPVREGGRLVGYEFVCPMCGDRHDNARSRIDTESGRRHGLMFGAEGRATIIGSIRCLTPHDGIPCTWHVLVEHGVARDA